MLPTGSTANEIPLPQWYALYTRHQHEKIAFGSLAARGFEAFLPLYDEIRQWSDRRRRLSLPLFPCYVFVRCAVERTRDILVTPGIHGFVSFDERPAVIPPTEIEDLRRVVSLARIEPHPFLRCGDRVRVKAGPFAGIEGILVRRKGGTRLVLSIELLQKSAAVEIDAVLTERVFSSRLPSRDGLARTSDDRRGALALR